MLEPHVYDKIKRAWHNLTDEEIACYEGLRDVFFLAVRKKYGLPRAQAEDFLRNTPYTSYRDVA